MNRPPAFPALRKSRIVLSVLSREVTTAEAARQYRVSEQSIRNWRRQFVEAGKDALLAVKHKPVEREKQLEARLYELERALDEAEIGISVWKKSAEDHLGPSRTSR